MARPRISASTTRNALIGCKVLLENSGYEVLEATEGDENVKLFWSNPVDAAVLD